MDKYAIVAIGYNRVDSILRLLNSLQNANFGDDQITLIISVDNCGNDEVTRAAEHFEWRHGEKKIRTFEERQGLRKHILSCADFFDEYDALFIFEDDVIVSPAFYHYGKACIMQYKNSDVIAGISLYALQWNPNANLPFIPLKTEMDTYFVQYAQSWGQIWLKNSFEDFIKWYNANLNFFEEQNLKIPSNLYKWGNNSWLKYHIAYCVMKNKYFVYPYSSYTSVFTEAGTHSVTQITRFHSDMIVDCYKEVYRWAEFDSSAICYDAFFESEQLKRRIVCESGNIEIDLYGTKKCSGETKYQLSTQILPYEVKKQYGLQLRPIELNIYMNIEGDGIYLYDTDEKARLDNKVKNKQIVLIWNYFFKERFLDGNEIFWVSKEKLTNLIRLAIKVRK